MPDRPPVELEKGALPLVGVIGQSVSGMGVSGIVALLVPIVAVTAGSGGWLAWAICTVLIIGVATCISALARRMTTTGGLYGLAAASLGPFGAVTVGWIVLILIGGATMGTVIGFGIYFSQFVDLFGIGHNSVVLAVSYFLALGVSWWAAYSGVRRSAWVMLSVEVFSIAAILILLVAVLVTHNGSVIDTRQLHLQGASAHGILQAAVFGVLAFGGFESATVFGREARNPRRAIPVAMMSSVVASGLLWIFASYVLYLGFQGSGIDLAKSQEPLHDLSTIAGITWFGDVIDFVISITLLSSMIAVLNGVSRLMLTASQEGIAPPSWSTLHPKYRTPSTALNVLAGFGVLVLAVVVISDVAPFKAFSDFGDLDGLAYLSVYMLMCLGAVMFLRRRHELRAWHVVVAVLTGGGLGYVFYSNVIPIPSPPDDVINALALVVILLSIVGYFAVRRWRPAMLDKVGSTVQAEPLPPDPAETSG
jgi:amino acid transporter